MIRLAKRLLRLGTLGVLAVLLTLSAALLWLTGTQQGLHFLLRQAAPYGVTVQQATGRLLWGVDLQGMQLDLGNTTVAAGHLRLRWRPWQFPVLGTLAVDSLVAEDLTIETMPTPPSPPKPLPRVVLPLPVTIHHLEAQRFSYRKAGQELYGAQRIWLAAHATGSTVTIRRLALTQPDHRATLAGVIRLQDAYPMRITLQAGLDHIPGTRPHTPPLALQGSVRGDLERLQVQLQTSSPQQVHIEAQLTQLLRTLHADARVRLAPFDVASLFDGAPQGLYGGAIHIQGNPANLQLNAQLAASHSPLGSGAMLISAQKKGDALHDIQADWRSPTGTIHVQGTVNSLETQQASATLTWKNLRLPDMLDWHLDNGTLHLKGSAAGFDVQGTSQATWIRAHQEAEVLQGSFDTHIAPQAVEVKRAVVHGLGATVALQGRMSLQSSMQFAFKGTLHDVDPSRLATQWPGRLEAAWEASGHIAPRWQVTASLSELRGQLRDRPVRGHLQASASPGDYRLSALELHSGKAQLQAHGHLQQELSLALRLNAPQLDDLLPQAAGSLNLAANLSGPLTWPALRLEATGRKLRYQDWSLEALRGSGQLFAQDSGGKGTLRLQARQLRLGATQIAMVDWKLDGTANQHSVDLVAEGPTFDLQRLHLALQGGFSEKRWQGMLRELEIRHATLGRLALAQPTTLSWSQDGQASLQPLCLQQATMRLCAEGALRGPGAATVAVSLHQVRLHQFEPLLPTGYHVAGDLQGQIALQQTKGHWQGQGHIALAHNKLTMEDDSAEGVPPVVLLDMPSGRLEAELSRDWQLNGQLHLANQGMMQLQGHMPNPANQDFDTLPIKGMVRLQRLPLGFLGAAVPDMAAVDMEANGRLDITGTAREPVLAGGFAIANGRFELPALGLDVHDLDLGMRTTSDNQIKLTGALTSGKGRLNIAALGGLSKGRLHAQGTIQGDDVLLADIPQAQVTGSPNLALTMTPQRLHVAGTLALPKGKLQPALLPSGVGVSSDEVIVGQQPKQNAATHEASLPLSARLRLMAGPDLAVRAKGVQGKLEGDLTVVIEPRNPPVGVGEMRLVEGSYKAYGQDLQIGTGRVLFTGGPLSNPGLDLQATRAIEGGNVGLHVRGTVNKPELSFTSDPPQSESDTLAYLLFGRPMRQTSAEESNMINQGMLNAGVRGSEFLAKMVGKRFGLSDVHVESTAGSPESAQLVVGRQLSPRITVGYGVGIFDGLSTAHITYSLTPSLSLRTQAGMESAADLLYSLER